MSDTPSAGNIRIPEFVRTQFDRTGLTVLAEKLAEGLDPSMEDALQLSTASLPLLGKLVEIKRSVGGEPPVRIGQADRFIALDPRASVDAAQTELRHVCEKIAALGPFHVSIAPWSSLSSWPASIAWLAEVVALDDCPHCFIPLGPTAEEVSAWLGGPEASQIDDPIQSIAIRLQAAGVASIAGADLDLLHTLAKSGMSVQVEQDISDEPPVYRRLVEARETLHGTGRLVAWSPRLAAPLGQGASPESGPSGLEVLRAIALARLILPRDVQIRAPLATLGGKLAHVALDFGASHLGFVPAAGDMAELLAEELSENAEQTLLEPA